VAGQGSGLLLALAVGGGGTVVTGAEPVGLLLSITKETTSSGGTGAEPIGLLLSLTKQSSVAPTPSTVPPRTGGAFTRGPDRAPGRRLTLRDLQEHFSAEQDALQRAEKAKRESERKALEDAAAAVSSVMRAAVGADEAVGPDLADIARKLEAAATAKRITHAVRLANDAAISAARVEQEILLEKARHELWQAQDQDDEDAAFLLL
jgi:hypothetical protein